MGGGHFDELTVGGGGRLADYHHFIELLASEV